jgi:ATP-dependent DNA helicase RecG
MTVQRGTKTPYYISDKGLKPTGVYVRQGTASVPASENAIRQMIKETDGDKFEEIRSFYQKLNFEVAIKEFKKRGLELGETQMKTLGIISTDNLFTNLGLLLSDQCTHTIKVAVFSGISKSEFKDRREFGGSLLKQMTIAYEFIDLINKTRAEFVSIGGLVRGISVEDIKLGISQTRNEKLASVFYRLRLIEAYGTGIIKIIDSYSSSNQKPELKVSENAFMIALPNINFKREQNAVNNHEYKILEYLKNHTSINRKEVEQLLDVGQTMAGRILKEMVTRGQLKTGGKAAKTKYFIV